MEESLYKSRLEKNIGLYSWFKIFTKRVYLPIIAIQLVNVGNVTVQQLAIIASVTAIIQLLLQVPTGYIADVWGNKRAIVLGAAISTVSPLFYILMPNFVGGLLAAIFFFGGYSFQSGAIESFIHDTLITLGKEDDYSKVMGRAQSYGLIGNIILISLVPATYAINHSLPFLLGFVSLVIMLWIALNFTFPERKTESKPKNPFVATRNIVTIQNIAIFIFAGAMAGVMNRAPEYRELLFQDLGINVTYFGVLLALGSIAGAVMGWFIHLLDKLKSNTFYFIDFIFISICLVATGITRNPIIVVAGFTLFAAYSRVRLIIVQAKLLHNLEHAYKATLLSALNLFSGLADIIAISVLAIFISSKGYSKGYLSFGVTVFIVGFVLWAIVVLASRYNNGKETEPIGTPR